MKGECEDGGVGLEDGSGTVALVHVTIDHGNARRRRARRDCIPLNDARGDGDIVEDTVAGAVIAEGVMRAAGEVHRGAFDEREARRGNRSTNAAPRPFDHRRRPWKSDPALLFRRQAPLDHVSNVCRIVREQEMVEGDGTRLHEIGRIEDAVRDHTLAQLSIFQHRERMRGRERQDEVIAVEGFHRQCQLGARRSTVRLERCDEQIISSGSPSP